MRRKLAVGLRSFSSILGSSLCLRKARDFAVGHAAVRRLVDHDARLSRKLADRDAPFRRHRVEQHAARLRARDPQCLK